MKYAVILTENPDGRIHVAIPALPHFSIEAEDREAAIALARETISRIASRSEVVYLDIPEQLKSGSIDGDVPWDWFGKAKDDMTWNALFDDIERYRDTTRKAG
jgi:hypothetical protein